MMMHGRSVGWTCRKNGLRKSGCSFVRKSITSNGITPAKWCNVLAFLRHSLLAITRFSRIVVFRGSSITAICKMPIGGLGGGIGGTGGIGFVWLK